MPGREAGKTVKLQEWSTKQASLGAADSELNSRREMQNNNNSNNKKKKKHAKEVLPGGRKA